MGDWLVFGNTKVTLSESFLDNMPASLNKVDYFKESFQDLKFAVSEDGGGTTFCLEGMWEAVIKAQHVLSTSLEKWNVSRTVEVSSKQQVHPQDISNPCFISETSSRQQGDGDVESFQNTKTNISVNKEAVIVTKPNCKSSLQRKCPKPEGKNKTVHQSDFEARERGTSPLRLKDQKLLEEQNANLSSSTAALCSAENEAYSIEDADGPDVYYDQVTSAENEVYMDIQLEHNYNHLRSAENIDIGSDIDEPTTENEIYMDITLSKPKDEIFTDPDMPVTLVVSKDEPEVLQLNVNKTHGLMSPYKKSTAEGKVPSDHQVHLKTRRKKYEEQAPFKYFCNQCSFKTKRHSHMRNHSRLHERICTIYSCDQCDFSTIRASHLQRHLGTHKTEVFACAECTYSSHSEALLNKHLRCKHIGKKSDEKTKDIYQCLQCDYMTTSEKTFNRHLSVHKKKGRTKPPCFKCSDCSYQTPSRSNYYRHLSGVHGDERPFMCSTCGLRFKRSDTLAQHQATHGEKESGVNAFPCLKCKKVYRSANALREHQLTHEEERSYLCEICAASFKTRAVQRKHYMQKHVHAKVNQCPMCSKSFSSRYLVKRHMKVHTLSKHNTGDCASQVKNLPQELQPPVSGASGWCDSIVPIQSSTDIQVFVVHQEPSQAELSIQEGPLFQAAGQTMPVPVIPVEYVISTGDSENQNCIDEADVMTSASHIPSSEGEIITLAFVQGNCD